MFNSLIFPPLALKKKNTEKIKLFDKIIKLLKKKSHVTMRLGFWMEKTKEREKADIGKWAQRSRDLVRYSQGH